MTDLGDTTPLHALEALDHFHCDFIRDLDITVCNTCDLFSQYTLEVRGIAYEEKQAQNVSITHKSQFKHFAQDAMFGWEETWCSCKTKASVVSTQDFVEEMHAFAKEWAITRNTDVVFQHPAGKFGVECER